MLTCLHRACDIEDELTDGDEPSNQIEGVTRDLNALWLEHLSDGRIRVLSVEIVDLIDTVSPSGKKLLHIDTYHCSENSIDDTDEGLSDDHAFPEIERLAHFCEKGNEQDRSRV